jgi:hypothetical protein
MNAGYRSRSAITARTTCGGASMMPCALTCLTSRPGIARVSTCTGGADPGACPHAELTVRRATAGTTKIHLMAVASHERAPGAQVAVDGPAA